MTVTSRHQTGASTSGPSEPEKEKAQAAASKKLEAAIKRKERTGDVDREVLCPECGRFDAGAMSRHFPKGYAAALLRKFRGEVWGGLFNVVFFVMLLFFVLRSYLSYYAGGKSVLTHAWEFFADWNSVAASSVVFLMPLVFSILLTAEIIPKVWKDFSTTRSNYRKVREMIEASSEADLLALVVAVYRLKKGSLAGSGKPWIDTLTTAGLRHHEGAGG